MGKEHRKYSTDIKGNSALTMTLFLNGGIAWENGVSITYTLGVLWESSPTLKRERERELIRTRAPQKLKGFNVWVNEQLPPEIEKRRKKL